MKKSYADISKGVCHYEGRQKTKMEVFHRAQAEVHRKALFLVNERRVQDYGAAVQMVKESNPVLWQQYCNP